MSFNTYGQKTLTSKAPVQVWSEISGVKHSGGSIDGFSSLAVGTVIPAGVPVALDAAGGTIKPIYFYELAKPLLATDTEAILYGAAPLVATGGYLIVVPSTIAGTGTGVAYSAAVDNGDGTHTITIEANALGTATAGTIYAEADKSGEGAVVKETAVPAGLLWHDVVKEDGDTVGTGAIVDAGRVFEDRIPAIPAAYKRHLEYVGIKFEKGI